MSVEQSIIIDIAKVAISIIFLLYASWSDYKTREVSNKVWAVYAPIALGLTLIQLLFYEQSAWPFFGLSVGLTVTFSLLLFYTGAFGGADAKAFMCIALALPFSPQILFTPLIPSGLSPIANLIFPFTILTNAVVFAAASAIYIIVRNIVWHKKSGRIMFEGDLKKESFGKKILILVTGYKIRISKLKEKWHIFPLEDVEENGDNSFKRKLVIVPKDEGREETVQRLSNAIDTGKIKDYVWATPGLPMLIFVTLGLIFALFFGDIVWIILKLILG